MMNDTPQQSIESSARGVVIDGSFGMGFGVVVVVVDSKDKCTKQSNVSNHEHLQFNHNIDHHHTRKTPCAALYDEIYVQSAIAEGAKKQHPCPASSSSSSSRGVVVID